MPNVDILTQIAKWCNSAMYIPKYGNDITNAYARGYEKGINDAKTRILEIINSEQ